MSGVFYLSQIDFFFFWKLKKKPNRIKSKMSSIENPKQLSAELVQIFAGANYHYLLKQYATWKHLIATSDGNLKENFMGEMDAGDVIQLLINLVLIFLVIVAYYRLFKQYRRSLRYLMIHTILAAIILALDYGFILSILYMIIVTNAKQQRIFG